MVLFFAVLQIVGGEQLGADEHRFGRVIRTGHDAAGQAPTERAALRDVRVLLLLADIDAQVDAITQHIVTPAHQHLRQPAHRAIAHE